MNKIDTFSKFLTTYTSQISVVEFLANLTLTALLAFLLGRIYIHFGEALSNRRMFSRNFVLLSMTTMLIITIVKSSLALSLGLVGALSIIRFRAAIKDPEELTYLFLCIAIGLGFGASQTLITVIGFAGIACFIVLKRYRKKTGENPNLILTVSSAGIKDLDLNSILDILKKHCSHISLNRFEEMADTLEAILLVEFKSYDDFNRSRLELKNLGDNLRLTFVDNKGII